MSAFGSGLSWLGDGSNWTGPEGLLHYAGGQLEVTGEALALALVVALPVGALLGHTRKGGALITALANLGRAVPTIGLLLLFSEFATFGVHGRTAVVSLALFGIPIILTNTFVAVSTVDLDTVDAGRGMGMRAPYLLLRVELPIALPLIASGVRTAAVQVFATATLATYVSVPTLGNPISVGYSISQLDEVTGAAIVVAVMALLLDLVLGRVQALLTTGTPGPTWRRVLPRSVGGARLRRPAVAET